ncbi:MAG TPA: hypothetical protein VN257_07705, partial [Actinotalea sp.]|nr:hypothetical protein [Actinotalea sp.]
GIGRHLLGILVGLLLTPVGLLLTGIGTARLAEAADAGDPADVLGLSLLVVGALVLGAVGLLAMWSAAVPTTGGLVWGLGLGTVYLVAPWLVDDSLDAADDRWTTAFVDQLRAVVDQLTASAVAGQLLVTGVLLLAAGIAAARARRLGRRRAEAVAAAAADRPGTTRG